MNVRVQGRRAKARKAAARVWVNKGIALAIQDVHRRMRGPVEKPPDLSAEFKEGDMVESKLSSRIRGKILKLTRWGAELQGHRGTYALSSLRKISKK